MTQIHQDIVAKLDDATKEQHTSLDEKMSTLLFSATTTKSVYRTLLEKFYGFYAPFEEYYENIEGQSDWQEVGLALSERKRMPLLKKDLLNLGVSDEQITHLAQFQDAEQLFSSIPQILGTLYAVEGATIGGQYIARQLEKTLHISAENGGAFFKGYGAEQTKVMWKQFCERVVAYTRCYPESEEIIIYTAKAHFAAFEDWIFAPSR
ncbi:MAG: biliverdin-producing heme oxygenase [Chloroflexota bacterium]|nr:biliverdin-producing heme oxygenase [Chloroflexota bacterium]